MSDAAPSLIHEYFELTKKHQNNYGENTVILMQVGAFFEIYGFKDSETGEISSSHICEVCQICQLNYSDKKICVGKYQVIMAGFRDYTLEKYLPKITESGYTAVVYVQEKNGKIINRVLHAIYSAGTYVSSDIDNSPQITNNIMCIWMDLVQPIQSKQSLYSKNLIYGVSVANIFTGESFLFEYECPFHMNPTTFDELERCISIFSPNEIIILSPFEENQIKNIIQYTGIKTTCIHSRNTNDLSNEKIQNCSKQKYIQHILSMFFGEESYQTCAEFYSYTMATQSFCFLLNFIQEHNADLVRNISLPKFDNSSQRIVLANHTLKQLNIIDDTVGKEYGKLSSVASFMNKCSSPMGRRLFQYQITNPTFDKEWLQKEYNMISFLLKDIPLIENLRKRMVGIRDLEKNCRQLILRKLYPSSLYFLYKSIEIIRDINALVYNMTDFTQYFDDEIQKTVESICDGLLSFLFSKLNVDLCRGTSSLQNFENNIICTGVSQKLDNLVEKQQTDQQTLNEIQNYFNKLIRINASGKDNDETEYIKIHETEKSGKSLQITPKRATVLQGIFSHIGENKINIMNGTLDFLIDDVKFSKVSTNMSEIHFSLLDQVLKRLHHADEEINRVISEVYMEILNDFEKQWFSKLEVLSKYVAKLDVLQSKTYVAHKYNYCCPIIQNKNDESYVDIQGIRHALIEHINQHEIYVTNDLKLDHEKSGILLYGTNAVGKTSLIRALGISIIMAQSGMFVPCSGFTYWPYTAIFSRILSNDNLFKGLSTFAVEMSELRVILKMADECSLILGDELASGTENESALSIFVSALCDFDKKKSTYMFATHFHEITKFEEVLKLEKNRLCFKHLSVQYDRDLDGLVYDRKLKEGQGSRIYGLEVCLSLHLPKEFMDMAFNLRNKYFPESRGELSFQTTKYNAQKIRSICEICKNEIATEVHHLVQQKEADANGFIGSFHKNHVANLASVCEKCHLNMHHPTDETVTKKIRKKTTKGYQIK